MAMAESIDGYNTDRFWTPESVLEYAEVLQDKGDASLLVVGQLHGHIGIDETVIKYLGPTRSRHGKPPHGVYEIHPSAFRFDNGDLIIEDDHEEWLRFGNDEVQVIPRQHLELIIPVFDRNDPEWASESFFDTTEPPANVILDYVEGQEREQIEVNPAALKRLISHMDKYLRNLPDEVAEARDHLQTRLDEEKPNNDDHEWSSIDE